MKPVVVIISIYFMLLAVLPCHCNIVSVAEYENNETSLIVCMHNDKDTDHELDICTPFCSCASAHYPNFITQNNILIKPFISFSSKEFTIYNESSTASFSGSLLRPPQV